jgi:hypothetical protein
MHFSDPSQRHGQTVWLDGWSFEAPSRPAERELKSRQTRVHHARQDPISALAYTLNFATHQNLAMARLNARASCMA